MDKIFKLNSWKVFLLMMLPVIFPKGDLGYLLTFIHFIFCLCWFYYLASGLYEMLPAEHNMSFRIFKFHFFFPLTYFTIAIIFTGGGYSITLNGVNQYGPAESVIIPLHMFSLYCVIYCIYFIAKTLDAVETQNSSNKISGFIWYILALWLLPIGIWFIQPSIRELFSNNTDSK